MQRATVHFVLHQNTSLKLLLLLLLLMRFQMHPLYAVAYLETMKREGDIVNAEHEYIYRKLNGQHLSSETRNRVCRRTVNQQFLERRNKIHSESLQSRSSQQLGYDFPIVFGIRCNQSLHRLVTF